MSHTFDELEYPDTPTPLPTDTLVDSVLILLGLTVVLWALIWGLPDDRRRPAWKRR